MSDLETARRIAEQAHMGQKRKNGEDYINHPIRVSKAASKYGEDAAIVGMLHDVLEDSNQFSISDLQLAGFGHNIIIALSFITKMDKESYLDYILDMYNASKMDIPKKNAACVAVNVKLCDIEDNLNGAKGTLKDKYELARYILTH